MEPVNIWTLPKKERDVIINVQLEKYSQFMALPEEEREGIYYSSFLKAISSCDSVDQEALKEEYKVVYAEMIEKRDWIDGQQRTHREKYPNGLPRSYANCYKSGRFTVFWMEKRLEYNV